MPRRSRISARATAFHEAAHAVARLHVGASATAVQIVPHGMTHGSRRWAGRGERRMWNWLLVLFAGSYAQAFETRRSLTRTVLHSGKLDMAAAAPAVAWLVRRGYGPHPYGGAETRPRRDTGVPRAALGCNRAGCRWAAEGRQPHRAPGASASAHLICSVRILRYSMYFQIADPQARADIIAYLKELK